MKLSYQGPADVRELAAADFKSLGVEGGKKLSFKRDEPITVDDALGEAILQDDRFGRFARVEDKASVDAPERMTESTESTKPESVKTADGPTAKAAGATGRTSRG